MTELPAALDVLDEVVWVAHFEGAGFVEASPPLDSSDLLPPEDTAVDPAASDGPVTPDDTTEPQTLRVVDRTSSDGLLDTIVGGVAGFFLGG